MLAINATGDLTLSLFYSSDVEIDSPQGSAWVVDAKASGELVIDNINATAGSIVGGGLLRGVSGSVKVQNVTLQGLNVTRGLAQQVNRPTDAVIQLQAVSGPPGQQVGSSSWVEAANTALLASAAA